MSDQNNAQNGQTDDELAAARNFIGAIPPGLIDALVRAHAKEDENATFGEMLSVLQKMAHNLQMGIHGALDGIGSAESLEWQEMYAVSLAMQSVNNQLRNIRDRRENYYRAPF